MLIEQVNLSDFSSKINLSSTFSPAHILNYTYPNEKEFRKSKINIIYLGPAINSWSMLNNGLVSVLNGLQTNLRKPSVTGDYTKVAMLDEDFTREQLFEKFPTARTFPQITINGENIGGYTEFRDYVHREHNPNA